MAHTAPGRQGEPSKGTEDGAGVHTLIVDDEPDMRFLMRATLLSDVVDDVTDEACDADEAMAAWQLSKPDVIVLDLRMPGRSGLDLAREILATDPAQRVVMCSAFMEPDDVAEAHRIGVAAVVDKYQITTLPDVLDDVFRAI
jgi:DNA-binding NarL/FixJ family response regulator